MKYSVHTILSVTVVTGLMVLSGCSSSSDNDDVAVAGDIPMTPLDDEALGQLEGFWEQRGYGNLYEYAGNRTTWYTLTENTCLEVATDPGLVGLSSDEIAQTRYHLGGDNLSLALPGSAFALRLDRLETLPARCEDMVARDAQGMFDYVWQTFDEYYAFFSLRNVDWPAEYASQLPRVGEATDDEELFSLLSDLLSPIDDGHVVLASDDEFYSPAVERGADLELQQGFEAQNEVADPDVWVDNVFDRFREVILSRMDADSISEQGPLTWATADDGSIGYLFILGMSEYVLDAEGEPLDASAAEELASASTAMDLAMADLADTTRLIIDVRLNGGGLDAIALNFAQRFVSDRQLALSKSARSRDFQSVPVEAWLEPPTTGAYLNPVTLIVGADTASAAEIFAIPMHRLPQVTLIGERTAGILSDILEKPLPNGWFVGLSNEVYLDAQGVSFEGAGVSPDIEVPVFRLVDIEAGVDPALDRALAM